MPNSILTEGQFIRLAGFTPPGENSMRDRYFRSFDELSEYIKSDLPFLMNKLDFVKVEIVSFWYSGDEWS